MYDYLKESQNKLSNFEIKFFNVPIIFKDPFLSNITVKEVFHRLEELIPIELVQDLDRIYIGQFKHLVQRNLLASYDENVIYISNTQPSEEKLIRAIIHEFAHVTEEEMGADVYGDKLIKKEFLQKRMWLYEFLKTNNFDIPPLQEFMNIEWNSYFEAFLYEELGENMLLTNTVSVFPTPYSIVSLREYFGIGFEMYFSNNSEEILSLKKMCPILYDKLRELKHKLEGE